MKMASFDARLTIFADNIRLSILSYEEEFTFCSNLVELPDG